MGRAIRIGATALGGVAAVLAMSACQPAARTGGGPSPAPTGPASAPAAVDASAGAGDDDGDRPGGPDRGPDSGPDSGHGGGQNGGNGGGGGQPSGGGRPGHGRSTSTPGGAQIVHFTLLQKPRCPSGTTAHETPGVPAKIGWQVSGATGVALSVDNPDRIGSYGRYGAEGTLELTFSCGGPVGSTETHTYTLTTTGGTGPARARSLTVSTKVLERGVPV